MIRTKLPSWLAIAIVVPAILSLFSIYRRNQAESLNRAVTFAVEYETIENFAASQGITTDAAIEVLKPQGLNAVVLGEETITELIGRGRATLATSLVPEGGSSVTISSLRVTDPRDLARIQRGLQTRLQPLAGPLEPRNGLLPLPSVSATIVRGTSIGLNPDQTSMAQRHNLLIIARCANPSGVSAKTVSQTLSWAHELGAAVFLPEGDQVLGRRDALEVTVSSLQALGMLYATPEFAKIGGDTEMVAKAPEIVVRLHAAQAAELDKLTLIDAVERYAKAARERNMRILLIRPFTMGADQPLTAFSEFLHLIRQQIEREHGSLGRPKPFEAPNLPRHFSVLIALSLIPPTYFVGSAFFTDRRFRVGGGILLCLLAISSISHFGTQLMALVATLTFPVAAFLVLDSVRPKNVLAGFLMVSAISVIGGLCVAGMLNGLPYYIKAEEFSGVKLSVFLPILIVGYLFLDRLADVRNVFKSPITWGTAALGLTIIAVLGLMIARTGNDSGVGASGGEMIFRNFLDRFLYVRPRTKEFMIGHPLLIVGIGLLSYLTKNPRRTNVWGGWAALLIMVGSMGQTSIVNTLTHLHIPATLSLARIGLGVILGSIIGLALWTVGSRLLPTGEEA